MTKKRSASSSSSPLILLRRHLGFAGGFKLLIFLLVLICFAALLRLQSQFKLQPRRSFDAHFQGVSKIAFLFLVRQNLPLDFIWHSFFKNGDAGNFSIYIHSKPGFVFDKSTTRSAFFYGRQLKNSIQVDWGKPSMIEAERLLLGAALGDPGNQRFVLLSDSCVPLYNFSYLYNYLMFSPRSFVDSFLDTKESRYNPKMSHIIPEDKWRKGSQWVTLVRKHAEVVADDDTVFPVFEKLCERRPLLDLSKGNESLKLQQQHNCIPDEHYVPTLLTMSGLQDELERRTLTYSLWNQSAEKTNTIAWHPVTFGYADASQRHITQIKEIDQIFYKSENRTERCSTNSRTVPCYLFARKFSRGAAMRLLTNGVVGPYDPMTMFDNPT